MPVIANGDYDFPAADRKENFGDDQLVHVWWENNMFFCAAVCLRAPSAIPWSDFKADMIDPWASLDPSYTPDAPKTWSIDGKTFEPSDDQSLADLGVVHKGVIAFTT